MDVLRLEPGLYSVKLSKRVVMNDLWTLIRICKGIADEHGDPFYSLVVDLSDVHAFPYDVPAIKKMASYDPRVFFVGYKTPEIVHFIADIIQRIAPNVQLQVVPGTWEDSLQVGRDMQAKRIAQSKPSV